MGRRDRETSFQVSAALGAQQQSNINRESAGGPPFFFYEPPPSSSTSEVNFTISFIRAYLTARSQSRIYAFAKPPWSISFNQTRGGGAATPRRCQGNLRAFFGEGRVRSRAPFLQLPAALVVSGAVEAEATALAVFVHVWTAYAEGVLVFFFFWSRFNFDHFGGGVTFFRAGGKISCRRYNIVNSAEHAYYDVLSHFSYTLLSANRARLSLL